jgi:putative nucleotidyltransferase with HDIG domain
VIPVHRILIVDDEAPILNALRRVFEAAGYRVTACLDPADALDELREGAYQVVSADYTMPQMSGAEFLARARQLRPDSMRILLTAGHDFGAAVDAINNGEIFRILNKPWSRSELLSTVRQACDTYALRERNRQLTQLVQDRNGELQALNRNLEALVQERTTNLLDGMIAVLDYRDTETQWHSRRVARYSRRIAQALGIVEPRELSTIERGALLHDIGKIGVRDAVLLKPGPLDHREWIEMKEHPQLGWALLQRIDFLKDASLIVLQHQERFDGRGYPQGLSGSQIVVGARIFAVADTHDAITSDRPYRRAQAYGAARAEIARVAGAQLDPEVVDAWLSIPEAEWERLREDVEQQSHLREQAGWTPRRLYQNLPPSAQTQPSSTGAHAVEVRRPGETTL